MNRIECGEIRGPGEWAVVSMAGMTSTIVHHSKGGEIEDQIKYVGNNSEEVGLEPGMPPEDGLWLFVVDESKWKAPVGLKLGGPDDALYLVGHYVKLGDWRDISADLLDARFKETFASQSSLSETGATQHEASTSDRGEEDGS